MEDPTDIAWHAANKGPNVVNVALDPLDREPLKVSELRIGSVQGINPPALLHQLFDQIDSDESRAAGNECRFSHIFIFCLSGRCTIFPHFPIRMWSVSRGCTTAVSGHCRLGRTRLDRQ